MRNAHLLTILLSLLVCWGCEPRQPQAADKARLDAGHRALEARQYEQAVQEADAFLARVPHGPATAEALYLKGRGIEGRVAADPQQAQANLQEARGIYMQALRQNPSQPLAAYIRTSLANVAYFQDDYATAVQQWRTAMDHLDSDDLKAWALYRIGLSQQRLGQFAQADDSFARVQRRFAGTVPAARAREHQGAHGFYVQLATFASPGGADTAAGALRKEGVTPVKVRDAKGRDQVRVGPVPTYAQAVALRNRFTGKYPDAIIVP